MAAPNQEMATKAMSVGEKRMTEDGVEGGGFLVRWKRMCDGGLESMMARKRMAPLVRGELVYIDPVLGK